jgi:hypothetical protein
MWSAATALKDAANSSLDSMVGGMSYDLLSPAMLNKIFPTIAESKVEEDEVPLAASAV